MDRLIVIGGNVLIKKTSQQKYNNGNLLLPESNSDNSLKGTICGLGKGERDSKGDLIAFSVSIGDEVLFPKHRGFDIKMDDATYVVLPEKEIIAIITK